MDPSPKRYTMFFWLFLFLHILVWLILPLCTKPNYPLDVIECFLYGQEWVLSSGKHPPLPAWGTELVSLLTGKAKIAPYLCSQVVVALAFFSIWRLAGRMLSPKKALLAVCSMEFYTYFTFYSLEFNNSISLLACWSLAALSFFNALENGKLRYWILTGVFLGLGTLAKYSGFILVFMMLLFMVRDPGARRYWKTPGPYLTTLTAALIFLPHFLDVSSHHFSTLHYFSERTDGDFHAFWEHILYPAVFLLTQLGIVTPILVLFFIVCNGQFLRRTFTEQDVFHARFLNMLVAWPLLFQVLISALFGLRLDTIYGSHLWIFLGLYLTFYLEFDEKSLTLRRIAVFAATGMILMATVTSVRDIASPYLRHKPSRIHYPGQEIARHVETAWHTRYSISCPHLAGEWWLTGSVAAYGNDDPEVFCHTPPDSFEPEGIILSTWADPESINREGGVCLWNANHYPQDMPSWFLDRYPTAEVQPIILLPYSTEADIPPLKLGMAIIPPPIPERKNQP
ncbi:MAG: glycosyltransferase family 39 protein [Planctomycetaceae bacterium]|nr:glycosyltransferase family 39 protein [Planctomycetaceae bacterium]